MPWPRFSLASNGIDHAPAEEEVVAVMIGLAEGFLSEAEMAVWFRQTSRPLP
jgi:hypothetical protein